MKKITPFLWFDTQAEEAMNFYVSVFKNSKVLGVTPGPEGKAMSVSFELEGQEFVGFDVPVHNSNSMEAISFFVDCETQQGSRRVMVKADSQWWRRKYVRLGSKTNMVCLGRSFQRGWAKCSMIQYRQAQRVMQAMLQMNKKWIWQAWSGRIIRNKSCWRSVRLRILHFINVHSLIHLNGDRFELHQS